MTDETTQLAQQSTSIWPPHEAFYIDSMLFNSSSAVESIAAVAVRGKPSQAAPLSTPL